MNSCSAQLLSTRANTCGKSMGYLLQSLPVEIQTEIFIFAVCPLTCLTSRPSPQPVVLSHVSRAWRILAISAPHLWSSFSFELPRESDLSVSRQSQIVNRLQTWLERSRLHPLDFTLIQQRSIRNRGQPEYAEVLLSTLLSHSRRWRHVRVSMWNDDLANAFNNSGNLFPLLRSLTVEPTNSKTRFPFSFKSLEEPFSQLSSVHLVNYRQPPPIDQALRILSSASNVKSFKANLLCDSMVPKHEEIVIKLPNLTHIHIIFQHGGGVPRPKAVFEDVIQNCLSFLTSLSMSALRSFSLEWDVECTDQSCIQLGSDAGDTLVNFFQTLRSTLHELSLLYLPISSETLLECFLHIPLLRYLQLKYSLGENEPNPLTDKLLEGLTLHDSSRCDHPFLLLPLVDTMKIETHEISITAEQFARFVRTRMEGHSSRTGRLERLELLTRRLLYDQLPPELNDFTHRLDISSMTSR